jgi:hypothetical protein
MAAMSKRGRPSKADLEARERAKDTKHASHDVRELIEDVRGALRLLKSANDELIARIEKLRKLAQEEKQ